MTNYLNSWADIFRLTNAALAFTAALLLVLGRAAPVRQAASVRRMSTLMLAAVMVWQVYTSIEVIIATRGVEEVPGIRVYGFTVVYALLVVALMVEGRRLHAIAKAAHQRVVVVPTGVPRQQGHRPTQHRQAPAP